MNEQSIDPRLIMQAALDGELDAASQLAFERGLSNNPALAKEYDILIALRRSLRSKIPHVTAPAELRSRLIALARPAATPAGLTRRQSLRMAAAVAVGICFGGGATYLTLERSAPGLNDALIASHRRALLAETPVDIASNDRHNVRPWFDAHIAVSPPAPDLAKDGYPLIGGRVDVLRGAPSPTLVYRIREHFVSVTAVTGSAPLNTETSHGGYHIVAWRNPDFTFFATTDADLQELRAFIDAFRAEEASSTEIPVGTKR